MSLAVLAVGMAQVVGTHAGYLCGCTGQRTVQETCAMDDCHPGSAHENDGEATDAACGDHAEPSPAPAPDDHKHSEMREGLIVTGLPPVLALPAVLFFELPATFQAPDSLTPIRSLAGIERPEPPGDGGPPMPLLVARTMVMLV